jgi:aspartate/glutamate racemase
VAVQLFVLSGHALFFYLSNRQTMSIEKQQAIYPSTPDADGFYFENDEEMTVGVMTKKYENGNIVKRVIFPDGKTAIVRELTGKDQKLINRFSNQDEEKIMLAGVTVATTVDGKQETYEFFEAMKLKMLNRLMFCFRELNF